MHAGCVEAVFSSTDQMSDKGKATVQQLQAQPLRDNVGVRVQPQMHASLSHPPTLSFIIGVQQLQADGLTHTQRVLRVCGVRTPMRISCCYAIL